MRLVFLMVITVVPIAALHCAFSFLSGDTHIAVLLGGLALSAAWNTYVAFSGCVVSLSVILQAIVAGVCHEIKLKEVENDAIKCPIRVEEESNGMTSPMVSTTQQFEVIRVDNKSIRLRHDATSASSNRRP